MDHQTSYLKAYDTYADAIFRHCFFKTSNREQAKDLTQEVFIRAWSYVRQGREVANWRAFLFRLAHNLIIDWYRLKKSESLENLAAKGLEPASSLLSPDRQAEISETLRTLQILDEEERSIVTWRYLDDLSPGEIAEILNQSQNNISVKLHRALKKLRQAQNL